jgi:hypothetical protein
MNTKEKPKSWAVLNDGSQRFKDTVVRYLTDNYAMKWEGNITIYYYGVTRRDCADFSKNKKLFSTILTVDEFCEIFLNEKKEPNIDVVEEKQTAVEWLVSRLNKEGFAPVVTQEEIEQAKAMEKEQIKDAVVDLLKSVSEETGVRIDKLNVRFIDGKIHVWKLVSTDNSWVGLQILKTFNINK